MWRVIHHLAMRFSAGSASTSVAAINNLPFDDTLKEGNWRPAPTFQRLYYKPFINDRSDGSILTYCIHSIFSLGHI